MFTKKPFIFLLFFLLFRVFFAQNSFDQYNRLSISTLLLEQEGAYKKNIQKAYENLVLSSKVNVHALEVSVIPEIQSEDAMTTQKIAKQIISTWFSRAKDGSFSTDLITERGQYNASELDIMRSKMAQRGLSFLDQNALNMLQFTYLTTLKFSDIRSWKEVYDAQDAQRKKIMGSEFFPVERTKNGFLAKATILFYQLDFSTETQSYFYNHCWINPNDDENTRAEKIKNFDNYAFKLHLIQEFSFDIQADQRNPKYNILPQRSEETLWNELVQFSYNKAFAQMEKKEANFEVRTEVYRTAPIRARIGKKEALYTDSRYFIYERVEENGKIKEQRRAVVRAKKVIDNEKIANGVAESSIFYQIAGAKIREGYIMRQRNDVGVGINAGYAHGVLSNRAASGVVLSLDYNLGGLSRFSKVASVPSLRIFADFVLPFERNYLMPSRDKESLTPIIKDEKFRFLRFGGGLRKDFSFGRVFSFSPAIAYWYETAEADQLTYKEFSTNTNKKIENDKVKFATHGLQTSLGLGVQIAYPLGLFFKVYYDLPLFTEDTVEKTSYYFQNTPLTHRHSLGILAGLRIEF
jgi:hypothetical protein